MGTDSSRITAGKPCLPPLVAEQQGTLIGPLLKQVSRSFYLSLRVLPAALRPPISLAYLLARATDTIADTRVVPRAKRIVVLRQLQQLSQAPDLGALADQQTTTGERELLERLDDCLQALARLDEADARRIHDLLQTIVDGQIYDLERFPGETEQELVALGTEAELDRYTYLVAGCVGEFWTRMCAAKVAGLEHWQDREVEQRGVRFGQGLQLVNILRDIPRDLRIGRCYLPVPEPRRLLEPSNYPVIREVYQHWLDQAVAHLAAGWEYTLAIPRPQTRLRLACVWPIWIGLRTIARLRRHNPLDPARLVRISRVEVYALLARSVLVVRCDGALRRAGQTLLDAAR
ncbi:squalene/phytoene synthase family protein [bacterium]|nr:squalene/phytoene synthase family protein [bacterium]